jgi:hypothetical protein
MVNVGIFYDHLEYFMAVWYSLEQEKYGNPGAHRLKM